MADAPRSAGVASSSWEGAPLATAPAGGSQKIRLLSESCVGAVFVDCVADGEWVATNVITYEKVALKAMHCETNENGDTGELVILMLDEHGGHTLVHPETLFARQLFRLEDGRERYVQELGKTPKMWSLDEARTQHRAATLSVWPTASTAKYDVEVYMFRRPRVPNVRVYWSLTCIYKAMGMTCYQKVPSKWIWSCTPKWLEMQLMYFGTPQLCYSTYLSESTSRRQGEIQSDRCLANTSISTLGLVALLTTWAFARRGRGAAMDPDVRTHARQLLERVIGAAFCRGQPRKVTLHLEEGWLPPWPRPIAMGAQTLDLVVGVNGFVDFSPLVELATVGSKATTASKWWRQLQSACDCQNVVSLGGALAALAGAKQCRAFVAQLLAVICTEAERTFTVVSQPRDAATTVTMPGLSWKWSGLADQVEDHRTRDRRLLEYVTACRRATKDVQHLTLCTDKGISGALPLQMTMFVMQENLAMVGCPQVVGSQAL